MEGDSRLGKDNAAQEKIKPVFFGKHVLGMMTTFSGIIGNPIYRRHEKRRCLKAMKLMLDLGRNDVAVALPQVIISKTRSWKTYTHTSRIDPGLLIVSY